MQIPRFFIQITNWQSTAKKINVSYVAMEIGVLSSMSAAVPLVMLLLTCVLLGLLMRRMIKREAVLIGTFYAQGYRRGELRRHYLMIPLGLSVIGAGIGSGLGLLLTGPMFDFMLRAFPMPVQETIYVNPLLVLALGLPVILLGNDEISFYVTGVWPDTGKIKLKDTSGQVLKPAETIMTAPLAEKLKIKAGDSVTVFDGENGQKHTFTIEKVADTYAGEFLFMPLREFNAEFGLPAEAYIGIWSDQPLRFSPGEIKSTKSMEAIVAGFGSLIKQMGPMIYGLIFAAFSVGLIILYIVTGLVVEESRSTVSLMKVFGYRKKEINRLILGSNTLIVAAGYFLGIPLLLASVGALYGSLAETLQIALPVKLNLLSLLLGFVVVLATFEFAKLMCKRKVARIPMSEALKAGGE